MVPRLRRYGNTRARVATKSTGRAARQVALKLLPRPPIPLFGGKRFVLDRNAGQVRAAAECIATAAAPDAPNQIEHAAALVPMSSRATRRGNPPLKRSAVAAAPDGRRAANGKAKAGPRDSGVGPGAKDSAAETGTGETVAMCLGNARTVWHLR